MGNYCSTVQVKSGDSCASLAAECGLSASTFYQYNPQSDLCSTLQPGQHVCCTSGSLPNYAPQPNANGSCASYLVVTGDSCAQLAVTYNPLTVAEIESYNNNTWGWLGCADLQAGENICLSSGTPPFPAPIPNAICGPQVPGTTPPTNGTNWALLNPCPLNACCDIWGQCGTYPEFCTASSASTGAPGTAAPGTNGCISNCGVGIVNEVPPAEFASIGYFEAFNGQRSCLTMNAASIDVSKYTHVHYAFGNITTAFDVNDAGFTDQFYQFLGLTGVKRIMSFGGWTFSTDPATYMIFREGVAAANRATLAQNVVNFLDANSLDGVDFDWEYPGEPDIKGIPPGSPDDGTNYLAFLTELRAILPAGKTISVAAPASFWYLRGFPIQQIAEVVDYIVYMTYDLHGIWDLGNSYSQDGCPGGNCLRSDINLTETTYALSMITKAGVPTNKIMVGVTSYGRTFTMSTPGCYGPMCTYTGPGEAGECTQTPGYIAQAEINQIIATNPTAQVLSDAASNSAILVYNGTQWVGYLDVASRGDRTDLYEYIGFGGTSEWAIDLESFEESNPALDPNNTFVPPSIWSSPNPVVACIPPCNVVLPPFPLGFTTTITWPPLTTTLMSLSGAVTVTITTTISIPAITTTEIEWWPVSIGSGYTTSAAFSPVQSVMPPSVIISFPPSVATFPPTQIPDPVYPTPPSSSTSGTPVPIIIIFPSTSYPVTIQPQPTISVRTPPPTGVPSVTWTDGPPQTTCTSGCGRQNCGLFGCGTDCGLFGCDGGCGIWGCGGGCGLFGCGGLGCAFGFCDGGCPLINCGGPGCSSGGCGCGPNGCTEQPTGTESCETSTSTDYWVSCESQSCTTTSSQVITGCYVTATATTVVGGCPTAYNIDPSADQGDDADNFPALGNFATVTNAESVVVGATAYPVYPVSGGSVVNFGNGTAYAVPSVASALTTTLAGEPVVLFPPLVGPSLSVTVTDIIIVSFSVPAATTTVGLGGCTANIPQVTNLPPGGTTCSTDIDCDAYTCPGCQWSGCLRDTLLDYTTCQCLPTEGQPSGETCSVDYDCAMYSCEAGQWSGCLRDTLLNLSTCQCLPMEGEPPGGTACSVDYDCRMYTCPSGQFSGCLQDTPGGSPFCACVDVTS